MRIDKLKVSLSPIRGPQLAHHVSMKTSLVELDDVPVVYTRQTGSWIAPSPNARRKGCRMRSMRRNPLYARSPEQEQLSSPKSGRVAQTSETGIRDRESHPYQLAVLVGTGFLLPILLRKQGVKFIRDLVAATNRHHGHHGSAAKGEA
jgi:hypothetical protein